MAAILPFLPAIIGAVGAIGGGLLGRKKESRNQKYSRETIDQLLEGVKGQGQYKGLFETDPAAFQRSYVDPAKSIFQNQIAPQIEQSYIASGQQRGTGLGDELNRAGVNMDQMLNQQYMNFLQQGQNRQFGVLGMAAGLGQGERAPESFGEAAGGGLSGYLGGKSFSELLKQALTPNDQQNQPPSRPGYKLEEGQYGLYPTNGFRSLS